MIRRFQNISHHLSSHIVLSTSFAIFTISYPGIDSWNHRLPLRTERKKESFLSAPYLSHWATCSMELWMKRRGKKKKAEKEKKRNERKKRKGNKKRGGETSRREGRREIDPADKGATPDCCRIVHALSHNKDDALSLTSSEYVWQDSRWHGRNRNRGRRARAAREEAHAGQGPEIKPLRQ